MTKPLLECYGTNDLEKAAKIDQDNFNSNDSFIDFLTCGDIDFEVKVEVVKEDM